MMLHEPKFWESQNEINGKRKANEARLEIWKFYTAQWTSTQNTHNKCQSVCVCVDTTNKLYFHLYN